MEITDIHDPKSQLSQLIDRALRGEEVIIARAGLPVAKLVPIRASTAPRVGGQWKGRVRIAEDFDELPDDVSDAFGASAP